MVRVCCCEFCNCVTLAKFRCKNWAGLFLAAAFEFCNAGFAAKSLVQTQRFFRYARGNNMLNANAASLVALMASTYLDSTLQSAFHGNIEFCKS